MHKSQHSIIHFTGFRFWNACAQANFNIITGMLANKIKPKGPVPSSGQVRLVSQLYIPFNKICGSIPSTNNIMLSSF